MPASAGILVFDELKNMELCANESRNGVMAGCDIVKT